MIYSAWLYLHPCQPYRCCYCGGRGWDWWRQRGLGWEGDGWSDGWSWGWDGNGSECCARWHYGDLQDHSARERKFTIWLHFILLSFNYVSRRSAPSKFSLTMSSLTVTLSLAQWWLPSALSLPLSQSPLGTSISYARLLFLLISDCFLKPLCRCWRYIF